MTPRRLQLRDLPPTLLAGLPGLLLLAAVAVPVYAIGDAAVALLDPAGGECLTDIVNPRRWLILLTNTAVVTATALLTAGSIGGLLALLAVRTDMPGRRLLIAAALLAACVPLYAILVFVFSVLPLFEWHASERTRLLCGLLYGLVYTPLAFLVLGAALRSSDRAIEEQALLDAGPWTVLRRITLPLAIWGPALLAVVIVLLVSTDSAVSDLLVVRTFAEEINSQFALDRRRAGPLLAALPALLVVAALLVTVQTRYRLIGAHSPWQLGRPPLMFRLGRWRLPATLACAMLAICVLGVVTSACGDRMTSLVGFWSALAGVRAELVASAILAPVGATLVLLAAPGLAVATLRPGWQRWIIWSAVILLLATPAPVVGINLKQMLNRSGLLGWIHDSPAIIVIGYFVRFLPIGVLLMVPAVRRLPRELDAAARVDGCNAPRLFWHVRRPALLPDAALTWLVILILCFGEVGATVLLHPPSWATASVRAFTLLHFGVYHDLAVLALASVAAVIAPWIMLVLLLRRAARRMWRPDTRRDRS